MRTAILEHYARYDENSRLADAFGQFEFERTCELIARHVPSRASDVLDVGGGTGAYSFWLAGLGHRVHLVDIVPRHIQAAKERQPSEQALLASVDVGDARKLALLDASVDVVLMGGPLYHLIDRNERAAALEEAYRVLRQGGVLLAIAINRYSGIVYGLSEGIVFEPAFLKMTLEELSAGVRRNPPEYMNTFREAYFHMPSELTQELVDCGFAPGPCLGVLGPAWQVPDLSAAWQNPEQREVLLRVARELESESILSPQIFCAANKPR